MNAKLLADPTLVIAAVFYGVLLTIAGAAGLFGFWLGWILLLSLWRYAYSLLRMVAQGRRIFPAPEIETLNPIGDWRLVMHFIAFPALVIVLTWVRPFGAEGFGLVLGWVVALAVMFVFPASAALMGITGSLEAAFNPAGIARVIGTLEHGYVTLVVACLSIVAAAELVPAYLLPQWGFPTRAAGNVLSVYAVVATFTLTGALLREHRAAFAIPGEIETEEERRTRLQRLEWRKTLDLAYASIRSGLLDEGYATLRSLSAQHGESPEVLGWLFDNMLEWDHPRHALVVGARLLERHVADGDLYAALELFKRCRGLSADFAVTPANARALATFARSIGRHALADDLAAARG